MVGGSLVTATEASGSTVYRAERHRSGSRRHSVRPTRWAIALCVATVIGAGTGPAVVGQEASVGVEDTLGPTGAKALESLLAQPRGFIGVQMLNLTEGLRVYFRVPEGVGVLVAETKVDGPAEVAGLRAGDVIVGVDEASVQSSRQVVELIGGTAATTVEIHYVRDGQQSRTKVPVEQRRSVVLRLSPSFIRQRVERGADQGAEITATAQHVSERVLQGSDLDLAVDQLKVFFSGEGLRRKMDRLEELDLREMELRIRALESELVALEKQVPKANEPPF